MYVYISLNGTTPRAPLAVLKRHGHNIDFWGLKRIARRPNHVRSPCYSFQTPKIDIVAVSFFLNTASPENFFFKFHPTLTANNSGLKPSKLKNYHIFGMPRTSAFSWYTPLRSYYWNTLMKNAFLVVEKIHWNCSIGLKQGCCTGLQKNFWG